MPVFALIRVHKTEPNPLQSQPLLVIVPAQQNGTVTRRFPIAVGTGIAHGGNSLGIPILGVFVVILEADALRDILFNYFKKIKNIKLLFFYF